MLAADTSGDVVVAAGAEEIGGSKVESQGAGEDVGAGVAVGYAEEHGGSV